jgi:DAK2 domain fusion protein YloV
VLKIETITAQIFAQMMVSGANRLYNHKNTVNDLNVFPVPDGDTGTNMSMTVNAMAKEISQKEYTSVSKVADAMSFATLRGARGNSGVILSQFFRGIAKNLKGKQECNALEFAIALQEGASAAYKAVMKPTEGTILTVAREAATGAVLEAEHTQDCIQVLQRAVSRGNQALARTTEQLPALEKAGVVDAGGQGWMFVLEGALVYLQTGEVEKAQGQPLLSAPIKRESKPSAGEQEIRFKYCTEFIVEKQSPEADVDAFRASICKKGDCMLVIDDEEIVKVHIHTNHPGFILEQAVLMGDMVNLKIDNMKHQHQSILDEKPEKAKVTVAGKKKKQPAESKDFGFVAVSSGKGFAGILKDLGVDRTIEGGQTMNPSTEDILKAAERVSAKTVFVFPNNKNILLAAQQAAGISEKNIIVVPTRNLPECIAALMNFNEGKTAEENEKAMLKAMKQVQTAQITYAVRDTQINEQEIKKGDIIGIIGSNINAVGNDLTVVCKQLVDDLADEDTEFLTIYYGKDVKKAQAEEMEKILQEAYPEVEVSVRKGGQPVYYYVIAVE